MNGVHDMGGQTCFGAIEPERGEPVFHADWERRVFALSIATASSFGSIDRRRHALETLDPAVYLASNYYQRWLARLENLLVEDGLATGEELASGRSSDAGSEQKAFTPLDADTVTSILEEGRPSTRTVGRMEPQFSLGEKVRARNINPSGHTRLTGYVRGRCGVIDGLRGTHCFPDSNAHGKGEAPQPLYSVKFAATELWGPAAAPKDCLYIDLWEDYLEPLIGGQN
jgi:nitrile hydratase subunit beta